MSKKRTIEDINADVDLSNTFLGKVFQNYQFNDTYESNFSKESFSNQGQPISKSSLIVEQKRDPKISPLFQKAVDNNDISSSPVCYFIKNGVLMQKCGLLKLLEERFCVVKTTL